MKILAGKDLEKAQKFMQKAFEIAKKSTCLRSKCGAVIIKDNEIIGEGFNSPPNEDEKQRRCLFDKAKYDNKVTDKTCCVHAEQRAMFQALIKNYEKIKGSSLYFIRMNNNIMQKSGQPYCTICSKMALDLGIKFFVLWQEDGIVEYETEEYNSLSYSYKSHLTNL